MNLNIGSGDEKFENFASVDFDPSANPDYCFDLEKDIWPFDDNSVDKVIAYHILEHMGEGFFHCMQELYRVCKHGSIIDVRVPHHRHESFLSDPTHRRPITVSGLWLFSKKYNDANKNSRASRLGYHYNVDFEVMDVLEVPSNEYIQMFEGRPIDEVLNYIKEHNNIIQEVQFKLVVIKEYD
jgi:hypothetical protein